MILWTCYGHRSCVLVRFLILDPHYTGKDDLKIIISKVTLCIYRRRICSNNVLPCNAGMVQLESSWLLG